jgi:phospholipid transport system substrate-binding protein
MSDKRSNTNSERTDLLDEQSRCPSPGTGHSGAVKRVAGTTFARFAKAFTLGLAVIVSAAATSLAVAAGQTPAEFISTVSNDVLAEMRSSASLDQKEAYFRQLLRQDFDLDGICRFVLGPYVRTATPEQRQEFMSLLENHIMRSQGRKLAESGGGDFRVTGSRTGPNGVVVVTGQIVTPQGAQNEVDFQLGLVGGVYKIQDVSIDDVSMALSYRSEIASMSESRGGQLATLLAALREED